tara:strand:+ start:323 stop:2179 length:1857 start_codon:yes stop_codon:yes gene_type:complete
MSVKYTVKTSQPLNSGKSQNYSQKDNKMEKKIRKLSDTLIIASIIGALVISTALTITMAMHQFFEKNAIQSQEVNIKENFFKPFEARLAQEKAFLESVNKLYFDKEILMLSDRANYIKQTRRFLSIRQSLEGVSKKPVNLYVVSNQFAALLTEGNSYNEPVVIRTMYGRNYKGLNNSYLPLIKVDENGLNNLRFNIKKYRDDIRLTTKAFNKEARKDVKDVNSLFDLIQKSDLKVGNSYVTKLISVPSELSQLPTNEEIDEAIANYNASQHSNVSHLYVLLFIATFVVCSILFSTIFFGYILMIKEEFIKKLTEERKEIEDYVEAILPSAIKDEEYVVEKQNAFHKEKTQDPIQLYIDLDNKINEYSTELENLQIEQQVQIEDLNKIKYKVEVAQAFDQTESYRDMYSVAVSIEKAIVQARKKINDAEDELTAAKRAEKNHQVKGATRNPAVRLESAKMKLEGLEKDLKEQKKLIAMEYSEEQQSHMNEFLAKCKGLDIRDGSTAYFQKLVEKKEDEIKKNIETFITEVSDKIANAVLEKEQLAEKTPEIYEQISEDTEKSKQTIYDLETIKRINKDSGMKVEEINKTITSIQSVKFFDIKSIVKMFKIEKKVAAKTA